MNLVSEHGAVRLAHQSGSLPAVGRGNIVGHYYVGAALGACVKRFEKYRLGVDSVHLLEAAAALWVVCMIEVGEEGEVAS